MSSALLHGTPARSERGCTCWRCVHSRPWPASARQYVLKWDLTPLLALPGVDDKAIKQHPQFGFGRLISWKNYGLLDEEADRAAVLLGNTHPSLIWEGWHEAALDYYPVEDAQEAE